MSNNWGYLGHSFPFNPSFQDSEIGILLPDSEAYRIFWPLLRPTLASFHGVHGRKVEHPRSEWPPAKRVEDFEGARVQLVLFEVRRNLGGYPLQTRMEAEDYSRMERTVKSVFGRMEGDFSGNFYSIPGGLTAKVRDNLEASDALFAADDDDELKAGGAYDRWPHGRGVFASHDRKVHVRVNDSDHFRLRCRQPGGKFRATYEHLRRSMDHWHEKLSEVLKEEREEGVAEGDAEVAIASDEKLGFITLSPAHLGTGLQVIDHLWLNLLL